MEPIFSVQPVLLLQDAAKPFIRTVLACKCHIQFLQRWHRFYWHLFVFVIQEALAVSQLPVLLLIQQGGRPSVFYKILDFSFTYNTTYTKVI